MKFYFHAVTSSNVTEGIESIENMMSTYSQLSGNKMFVKSQ